MRALTHPLAYVAGCLNGDAFLSVGGKRHLQRHLRLRVADEDFAEAFAKAVTDIYARPIIARLDERGYWHVRTYDTGGIAARHRDAAWTEVSERRAWLRGLFDSEGNAHCAPNHTAGRSRSWQRRVGFYSTDQKTLAIAALYLSALGVRLRPLSSVTPSAGHKGTKPVYELSLIGSRENYARFGDLIGSSIQRKRVALQRMVTTYHPDRSLAAREAQAKGVAVRRARRDAGGRY